MDLQCVSGFTFPAYFEASFVAYYCNWLWHITLFESGLFVCFTLWTFRFSADYVSDFFSAIVTSSSQKAGA